jgi:pSer/pThr/pTyr-binding forkhead associated (FHA) protein
LPLLIVTKDGNTVSEYTITENRLLIGRSDFADIVVVDDFVSKLHAVLLLYTDALVLLDLNSANGTTVNSVTVMRTILNDNDVISLGNHRLKVQNVPSANNEMAKQLTAPDTLKMKNLVDLRRLNARRRALTASQRKKLG